MGGCGDADAGELLEVDAGIAQSVAVAFDLADAKASADEFVEPYAAGDDVPLRVCTRHVDRGQHFGVDQR